MVCHLTPLTKQLFNAINRHIYKINSVHKMIVLKSTVTNVNLFYEADLFFDISNHSTTIKILLQFFFLNSLFSHTQRNDSKIEK